MGPPARYVEEPYTQNPGTALYIHVCLGGVAAFQETSTAPLPSAPGKSPGPLFSFLVWLLLLLPARGQPLAVPLAGSVESPLVCRGQGA